MTSRPATPDGWGAARPAPPLNLTRRPAARRVLAAADRLFYGLGIGNVGVDLVVREAGTAKATLYASFGTKDGLVVAYLEGRSRHHQDALGPLRERRDSAAQRIRRAFALQAEWVASPGWRGCAFTNACAEYPDPASPVHRAIDAHRAWMLDLFVDLARQAAAANPLGMGGALTTIWDGVAVTAVLDGPAVVAARGRTLVDAAIAGLR